MRNEKTFKALIQIDAKDNASKAIESFNARFSNVKALDGHFNFVNNKLLSTTKLFDKYGDKFQNLGKTLTKSISAPLVVAAGLGLKVAADFEKEMIRAKDATDGAMFDELRSQALSEASKTQFSPTEIAQGIGVLGNAGMKSPDILKSLRPMLDLASAGDSDLTYTSESLIGIQNALGLSADKMRDTVDKLTVAFKDSGLSFHDITEGVKLGSPMAKAIGQNIDSLLFGFSALSDTNIKGSSAGTGISSIFEELIKLEPRAQKAFMSAGIKPKDIYIDPERRITKPLLEIVKVLKSKNIKNSEIMDIFQVQGGRAMLGIMERPLRELEKKQKDIKENFKGRAQKAALSNTEGVSNQAKILGSNVQVLQTKIWEETGILKEIGSFFKRLNTRFADFNNKLDPETTKFGLEVAGLALIIGPFVTSIGILISFMSRFTQVFFGLKTAGEVFFFLLKRGLWIGAITAVIEGCYLLWSHWGTLSEKLKALNDWIKTTWIGGVIEDYSKSLYPSLFEPPKPYTMTKPSLTADQTKTEKKQIEIIFKNLPETTQVKEKGFLKGLNLDLGYAMGDTL